MASKRRLRRNACDGEKRHPDKTRAVAHLIHLKKLAMQSGFLASMRSYKCQFCHGWHVGHFA